MSARLYSVGLQALVDGPYNLTGVSRQMINFKRLSLTDFKVTIGLNAGNKALTKAWAKADIKAKWEATSWAQRLAKRATKASLTDFDRFSAMVTKRTVRALLLLCVCVCVYVFVTRALMFV